MCEDSVHPSSKEAEIQRHNVHLRSLKFIDPLSLAFTPVPDGNEICRIHALRCGTLDLPAWQIIQEGVLDGVILPIPSYAFLIEKLSPDDGRVLKRVVFDLGLRKAGMSKLHIHWPLSYTCFPDRPMIRRIIKIGWTIIKSTLAKALRAF